MAARADGSAFPWTTFEYVGAFARLHDTSGSVDRLEADDLAGPPLNPISITETPADIMSGQISPTIGRYLGQAEFIDVAHLDATGLHELAGWQKVEAPSTCVEIGH